MVRVTYDTFVAEPRRKKEREEARKKSKKDAMEEFNRLYDTGKSGCPVLKNMPSATKKDAVAIMEQCPVAVKFVAPLAILGERETTGVFANHKKWE